jgi:hypothetical protein
MSYRLLCFTSIPLFYMYLLHNCCSTSFSRLTYETNYWTFIKVTLAVLHWKLLGEFHFDSHLSTATYNLYDAEVLLLWSLSQMVNSIKHLYVTANISLTLTIFIWNTCWHLTKQKQEYFLTYAVWYQQCDYLVTTERSSLLVTRAKPQATDLESMFTEPLVKWNKTIQYYCRTILLCAKIHMLN